MNTTKKMTTKTKTTHTTKVTTTTSKVRPQHRHYMLCLDSSGSMAGGKHRAMSTGVATFLKEVLRDRDRVTVYSFNREVTVHGEAAARGYELTGDRDVGSIVARLRCTGRTALYGVIGKAVEDAKAYRGKHRNAVTEVIVFTDGHDTMTGSSKAYPSQKAITELVAKPGFADANFVFVGVGSEAAEHLPPLAGKGVKHAHLLLDGADDAAAVKKAFGKLTTLVKTRVETVTERVVIVKGTKGKAPGKACNKGLGCPRADCHFVHPAGWAAGKGKGKAPGKACNKGLGCPRADCHFVHPAGWAAGKGKGKGKVPPCPAGAAKTRLCRRWEKAQLADGEACSFSGCTFAHGPSELRNVPGGGGGGGGGGRAGAGGCAGVRAGGMASRPARPARRPAASTGKAPPPPARGLPSGWAQYADAESGTPYYHCSATGVTQWVLP